MTTEELLNIYDDESQYSNFDVTGISDIGNAGANVLDKLSGSAVKIADIFSGQKNKDALENAEQKRNDNETAIIQSALAAKAAQQSSSGFPVGWIIAISLVSITISIVLYLKLKK